MRKAVLAVVALLLLLPAGCGTPQVAQQPAPTAPPATAAATLAPAASPTAQPTLPPTQPAPTAPPSPSPIVPPPPTPQPTASGPSVDEAVAALKGLPLDEFFAESYKQLLLRNPEGLTTLGMAEAFGLRNDRLNNLSDAYIRETQALQRAILEQLRTYDRAALAPDQQLSYDVYEWWLDDQVRGQQFMYHNYPLNHFLYSYDQNLILLFSDLQPVQDKQDVEDYLARLSQVDDQVAQLLEGMRIREQLGVIPPRFVIERTLSNLQAIADDSPDATPFYQAFRQKVLAMPGVSQADQKTWLARAEEEIGRSVKPAFAEMAAYMQHLQTSATDDAGVWKLPDGDAYYQFLLHRETTTNLTPQQIHDLGLAEVARIQAEMRALFDELGYPSGDSLSASMDRAMQESGFYDTTAAGGKDQVVQAYQAILDEASDRIGSMFDLSPTARLVVVADPNFGSGGFYMPPTLDGSRPGAFHAGVGAQWIPKFSMRGTAYHEGIPGHHFQIAISGALGLPLFRVDTALNGYVEGWALYAEGLASELGLYPDAYSKLGQLQLELLRAVRLVTDTGIHALRWTREEATAYMDQAMGGPEWSEVGRYIVLPAQATSYKVGQLKIRELRQTAQDALGDRFDLKAFHRVILGQGAMPLEILERRVEEYTSGSQ
jgi:uncharacterized protein (DUF885 family)